MRTLRLIGYLVGVLILVALGLFMRYGTLVTGAPLAEAAADVSLRATFPAVSSAPLESARAFAEDAGSTALIVLQDGRLVGDWGATDRRISGHSVRKSLVGALYGIAVDRGLIDLGATLEQLGVDDYDSLTAQEKRATLEDLLTSRSGIYHPSVKDDGGAPPARDTHDADTWFFYNNWSFNALGILFEELTSLSMGDAFHDWIAVPTGMQDFRPEDVLYFEGTESRFRAWRFWISGRDMARFGQLYLQRGRWQGQQIVPESWVQASLTKHTTFDNGDGYGYLWWIGSDSTFAAVGTGGQRILVDPANDLVIVNRVDTGRGLGRGIWWFLGERVDGQEFADLTSQIRESLAGS